MGAGDALRFCPGFPAVEIERKMLMLARPRIHGSRFFLVRNLGQVDGFRDDFCLDMISSSSVFKKMKTFWLFRRLFGEAGALHFPKIRDAASAR